MAKFKYSRIIKKFITLTHFSNLDFWTQFHYFWKIGFLHKNFSISGHIRQIGNEKNTVMENGIEHGSFYHLEIQDFRILPPKKLWLKNYIF